MTDIEIIEQKDIDFFINLLKSTGKERKIEGTVQFKLVGVPDQKVNGKSWEMEVRYAKNEDNIIATIVNFTLDREAIEIPDEFLKSYEI